jgi:hypothetical protein
MLSKLASILAAAARRIRHNNASLVTSLKHAQIKTEHTIFRISTDFPQDIFKLRNVHKASPVLVVYRKNPPKSTDLLVRVINLNSQDKIIKNKIAKLKGIGGALEHGFLMISGERASCVPCSTVTAGQPWT